MIEVNRKALVSALEQARGFMAKKPTGWQTQCVIEAGGGAVRVTTTDGISRAVIKVCSSLETEPPFAVSLADLRSKLGLVSGETARIKVEKDRIEVACGAGKYKLGKLDPAEFPQPRAVEGERRVVSVASIRGPIEAAAVASDSDEERQHMCGVYLDGDSVVATDGHRVHMAAADVGTRGILPKRVASWLLSRGDGECAITFAIDGKGEAVAVMVEHDGSAVMSLLPDRPFPPYKQIVEPIVAGTKAAFQCPTAALDEALTAIDVPEMVDPHGASMSIEGESLVFRTKSGDTSSCPVEGEIIEGIHVAARLMKQALAVVSGDVTEVRTTSPLDGIVVSAPEERDTFAIVMPKRGGP